MSDSNAITMYERIDNPMVAVKDMGDFLAKSGMFGCEKLEQGMVLAMACICERKSPIEILKTYHIINGRLSMRADAMLARFREMGGKVSWKRFDNEAAVAVWTHDNNKDIEIGYTIDDAKKAGFIPAKPGSGWAKNPDAMLRARCVSKALRMLAPEVVAGTYTPEEIADDLKTVTYEVQTVVPTSAALPEPEAAKRSPGRPKKEATAESPAAAPVATPAIVVPAVSPAPPVVEKKIETPAPVVAATTPAAPAVETNPLPGKVEALEIICGAGKVSLNGAECEITKEQIFAYMYANKMLPEGKPLSAMDEKMMDRIMAKPDAFRRAVVAGVVPKK